MGKLSIARSPQNGPGSASREVFQGLFKDLGKQAMALEGILRVVCGRVDKLEHWLTEVSFGMTELDLKLRNIAHNIDGTTALDDEGKARWAVPPCEKASETVPTISKKLGNDKKAVRVTGMAADILDQLASTSASASAAADVEKRGKKAKKPSIKKVKSKVSVTSPYTIVETAFLPATPLPNLERVISAPTIEELSLKRLPSLISTDAHKDIENLTPQAQSRNSSSDSSPSLSSRKPTEVEKELMLVDAQSGVNSIANLSANEELEVTVASPLIDSETNVKPAPTSSKAALKPSEMQLSSPSVSTSLPTLEVERAIEPFVLNVSAQTPPVTVSRSSVSTASVAKVQPVDNVVPFVDTLVKTHTQVNIVKDLEVQMPIQSPRLLTQSEPIVASDPVAIIDKALQTTGEAIRAEDEPVSLQTSETTSARWSKVASHTKKPGQRFDKESSQRLYETKRRSNQKRMLDASKESTLELTSQNLPQQSMELAPPKGDHSGIIASTDASPEDVIYGESGEENSESSSDGPESSSGEDGYEDAEVDAAVEEISKTMTALKKLKRAHMLSPEEENELKERAHKQWFQLKSHIKEKKDVKNIMLKRKKNVFTVASRLELLEEKSREIFATLKQLTNDMREKSDRALHETLRRRVADYEQNLLNVDMQLAALSAPAITKVDDLEGEVASLRTTIQIQYATAQSEATTRHIMIEEALASQRALVESLAQDVPSHLTVQAKLFNEKLQQLPDHTAAIEALRRSLRRKADLKLLKELEARLLGLDAENEDCLVRCLSCHKEVIHPYNEKDNESDEQDTGSHLRKVNPGPSSSRIYRSNVPFSAQMVVQEPILEEPLDQQELQLHAPLQFQQLQSAGDSLACESPPIAYVPNGKGSLHSAESLLRRGAKPHQASPLSLMNITAKKALLSPDRPISASAVPLKRKSFRLLKSLADSQ